MRARSLVVLALVALVGGAQLGWQALASAQPTPPPDKPPPVDAGEPAAKAGQPDTPPPVDPDTPPPVNPDTPPPVQPPRAVGWHYSEGGDNVGPVAAREIRRLYKAKTLSAASKVWTKGMARMVHLVALPEFSNLVAYFYSKQGKKQGPVSYHRMRQLVQLRVIPAHALIWRRGLPSWRAAAGIEELQDLVQASTTPTPRRAAPAGATQAQQEQPDKGHESVRLFLNPSFFSAVIEIGDDDDEAQYVGIGQAPLGYLGAQYVASNWMMVGGSFGVAHLASESSSGAKTRNSAIFLLGKFGWCIPLGVTDRHRISLGVEAGLFARLYGKKGSSSSSTSSDASVTTFAWGIEALYHLLPFKNVSVDLGLRMNHLVANDSTSSSSSSTSNSYTSSTTTIRVDEAVIISVVTGVSLWF